MSDPEVDTKPPGLVEQFGRTRSAFSGLVGAHVELARAEFSEIMDEVKRAALLGAVALGLLMMAGTFTITALILFVDEAIFGSIGWGVLHGSELLLGAIVLLILAIIDFGWVRAAGSLLVSIAVGLAVGLALATDWAAVSRSGSGLPGPLLLALLAGMAIIGIVGLALGAPFGPRAAVLGLMVGLVLGAFVGLLGSANPGLRVAVALGVAALLLCWPIVAAVLVFRNGIDTAKLKKRFVPSQTIDTTKETIEWVREQMPLGRKS
jgi:uncharacterized membrane protein YqjE